MKRKAFTLIELIAVLVILAILALIVTPLVMNIIKKARISTDKRSIDAYGRSIELSVATFLLDEGRFPTNVSDLTIEYTGDEVICATTQLNSDSSVYLAGCTVAGRSVDYTYGSDFTPTYTAYTVGDEVTYNNVDYYVIKDSSEREEIVTLLKKEPLTTTEVNLYGGVGTENNHVNKYTTVSSNTAYDNNGYGEVAFYTSSTCGASGFSGCSNVYENSDIKYIVDTWVENKVPNGLQEARMLKSEDFENLGYELVNVTPSDIFWQKTNNVPNWINNFSARIWTMVPKDNSRAVWYVSDDGSLTDYYGYVSYFGVIRPVIVLSKSVL